MDSMCVSCVSRPAAASVICGPAPKVQHVWDHVGSVWANEEARIPGHGSNSRVLLAGVSCHSIASVQCCEVLATGLRRPVPPVSTAGSHVLCLTGTVQAGPRVPPSPSTQSVS